MRMSTPGKSVSLKKSNSGFTIIELMVVLAIVGLTSVIAAAGLRFLFNANLKGTSGRLATTLRYLSNKSVTDHVTLRMVYDLEGQSYHVEGSRETVVVPPDASQGTSPSAPEEVPEDPVFSPVESPLLKPVKLQSGVFFKDVSVGYSPQKVEEGKAYTYFFPDGFATPTLVNFRDEDDKDHYSVELLPLSGRVRVKGEYREMEKE